MKNKTIAILLLATMISISGCGGCPQNTDTTEAVNETESIIETEEPTEEEVAVIETETEEPIDIYSDEVIGTLAMYDFFEGSTADEIKQFIKDNEDMQEYLVEFGAEDDGLKQLKEIYGETLYEMNHTSVANENNQSSSKNNSSSTASTSNSNSSSDVPPEETASSGDTIKVGGWELPAGSVDNGDGTWTTPDGFTVNIGSYDESYEEPIPSELVQSEPTHVAEDHGYSLGSTITGSSRGRQLTLTYQGNDVWVDNEGNTWHSYSGSNGDIYWGGGIY